MAGTPQPPPPGLSAPPPQVPNHLVLSIVCTVLCCLPLGIVGIINATKVNGLLAQGDIAGAEAASAAAKKWSMIGVFVGIAMFVIGVIAQVVMIMAA